MTDASEATDKIETRLGISRRYLHDEVAERLRALIHAGEMEPRARINEGALTERFGISRTPLREAIKILATEGLLELLPNRGARVASLSRGEIEEMIEVIAGLEATACELACRAIAPDEVAAIEGLHAELVAAWQARACAPYFRLNRAIHEALMRASGNAVLQGLYASLSGRIQRARYTVHQTEAQWAQAVEDHERMIPLLRARDGEGLGRLMRAHIRSKSVVITENYGASAE